MQKLLIASLWIVLVSFLQALGYVCASFWTSTKHSVPTAEADGYLIHCGDILGKIRFGVLLLDK